MKLCSQMKHFYNPAVFSRTGNPDFSFLGITSRTIGGCYMAYKVVFGGITFWPHGTPLGSPLGAILLCSKIDIPIFIESSLKQPQIAYIKSIL